MSEWERDIGRWVKKWFKTTDPKQIARTQAIAEKEWDARRYNFAMRKDLHKWLNNWYTLSVKCMPKPATLRKNPISDPLHLLYRQIFEGNK